MCCIVCVCSTFMYLVVFVFPKFVCQIGVFKMCLCFCLFAYFIALSSLSHHSTELFTPTWNFAWIVHKFIQIRVFISEKKKINWPTSPFRKLGHERDIVDSWQTKLSENHSSFVEQLTTVNYNSFLLSRLFGSPIPRRSALSRQLSIFSMTHEEFAAEFVILNASGKTKLGF